MTTTFEKYSVLESANVTCSNCSEFPTLFGKDSSGSIRRWDVYVLGDRVVMQHGKVRGKATTKTVTCTAKNVGRSNETTPEQQAVIEAKAKWVKKKDEGYFESIIDAELYVCRTPMKAHNYNEYAHKVKFPCIVQPKLNGRRIMIDPDLNAVSKSGEKNHLLDHWIDDLHKLEDERFLVNGLDGEVFAGFQKEGGLSLQQINSAYLKKNENTERLQTWVYDAPFGFVQGQWGNRMHWRSLAEEWMEHSGRDWCIKIVPSEMVWSEEEADRLYEYWLSRGAEGIVYRSLDTGYEFGKRSFSLIKRKPRLDSEAEVVSVKKDRNGEGVLMCEAFGVSFDLKMRKDSHETINYREHDAALGLIGQWVTFEYEELSDDGVPTKPVGVGVRRCNEDGEPLE